ncbi:MAG: hypothetical protein KDK34_13025, partial [Leptospiraceae bacterium]|nr:hypothetical protein [Leptospiraceae bacterium]
LEIARKHIRRRYRLLPYIYTLFHESHATGAPVVRPLFYEFPELDPELAQDQFMLGSHILAAPVMERGQRMRPVYLPDGDWYEFESGKKYQGGAEHILPAEPGYFPVFVRAGAILPLSPGGIHSADALSQPPILEIYPAAKMFGRMTTDDGFSTAALQGTTMEMSMQANRERNGNIKLDVSIEKKKYVPPYRNMVVHLPAEYRSVSYRNKKEECSGIQLAAEDRTYSVSRFELPFQNIKAEFEFRPAFRV